MTPSPPPPPRNPRPLLVTFHCGFFFLYLSVFLMSISHRELEGHFDQMGPTFIRDMLLFMSAAFVGYVGLWNLRRWSLLLLFLVGVPFCVYGFWAGRAILLNFLPLLTALTCLPLWPILRKP